MQSASFRIWTHIAVSISYDDNHYTTGTSEKSWYKTIKPNQFTYLGSNISSTDYNDNTRLAKAWTVIDRLSIIEKSDLMK